MKKIALILFGSALILSSCKKYDFSEGEMSTVDPKFVQINNYAVPATSITLQNAYVDSLDTVHYNNGLGDTVKLVIDNPYNIPFSFQHDVYTQSYGHLTVFDQNWNQLDKANLNNHQDTLLVTIDCGPLTVGESKTLDIMVKHQDYLIRTDHYTATRQY